MTQCFSQTSVVQSKVWKIWRHEMSNVQFDWHCLHAPSAVSTTVFSLFPSYTAWSTFPIHIEWAFVDLSSNHPGPGALFTPGKCKFMEEGWSSGEGSAYLGQIKPIKWKECIGFFGFFFLFCFLFSYFILEPLCGPVKYGKDEGKKEWESLDKK